MSEHRALPIEVARPRLALLAFALVYAASLAFVVVTARELPDRVASSFGAGGEAHAFMARAAYARLFAGLSAALPLLLLGALAWLPRAFPRHANIPNRDYWLAPEHRTALFVSMERAGVLIGSACAAFLAAVHALVCRANELAPPRLANALFLAVLLAFVGVLAGTALWLHLALRRPEQRRA